MYLIASVYDVREAYFFNCIWKHVYLVLLLENLQFTNPVQNTCRSQLTIGRIRVIFWMKFHITYVIWVLQKSSVLFTVILCVRFLCNDAEFKWIGFTRLHLFWWQCKWCTIAPLNGAIPKTKGCSPKRGTLN